MRRETEQLLPIAASHWPLILSSNVWGRDVRTWFVVESLKTYVENCRMFSCRKRDDSACQQFLYNAYSICIWYEF